MTNPPFKVAHLILPHAFKAARVGVAFLLRLTYAEPAKGRGALAPAARRSTGMSDHGESASEVSGRGDQPGDRQGVRDGLCDGGVVRVVEGLELAAAGNSCAVPVCDGVG